MNQRAIVTALARGAVRRAEMLAQSGGVYSPEQAANHLGLNGSASLKLAKFHLLLRLSDPKSGSIVFPVFQFAPDGTGMIPGLKEVIDELREVPEIEDWVICNFLLSPRDSLAGQNPLALLRKGEVQRVVSLAGA